MARKAKAIFTNHPFTEGPKTEPIHVSSSDRGQFIYPDFNLEYSDLNDVFVSTDKITICSMDIGPGGFFNPPDYHPGDEAYFVLQGAITQFNPTTGQCIRVKKDEALLIPKGALHSAYNFEEEALRIIAVIAPKIVDDQLFPDDIPNEKNTFQAPKSAVFQKSGALPEPKSHGSIDDLGSWPLDGTLLRDSQVIYHIPEERKLLVVQGETHPILMKFSISNDFMHVGEFIVPAGGTTTRRSEPISHEGQTVLLGLDCPITIYLPDSRETYILNTQDALFLPEKTEYQLFNYGTHTARALFAIAPGL